MVLTIIAFVFKCHKSRPADNDWPERKIKEKNDIKIVSEIKEVYVCVFSTIICKMGTVIIQLRPNRVIVGIM